MSAKGAYVCDGGEPDNTHQEGEQVVLLAALVADVGDGKVQQQLEGECRDVHRLGERRGRPREHRLVHLDGLALEDGARLDVPRLGLEERRHPRNPAVPLVAQLLARRAERVHLLRRVDHKLKVVLAELDGGRVLQVNNVRILLHKAYYYYYYYYYYY